MKWAFLISGVVELIGGIICYLYPTVVFTDQHFLTDFFGLNAMIIGILNLLMYKHYVDTKFFKLSALAMMFMHGALAMICFRMHPDLFPHQLGGTITHVGLFIVFVLFYMKGVKKEE